MSKFVDSGQPKTPSGLDALRHAVYSQSPSGDMKPPRPPCPAAFCVLTDVMPEAKSPAVPSCQRLVPVLVLVLNVTISLPWPWPSPASISATHRLYGAAETESMFTSP